jgi:hypothetical protein
MGPDPVDWRPALAEHTSCRSTRQLKEASMKLDVQKRTEIAKLPAEVYRFIATEHGRNHPRWDAWAVEFKQIDPGPVVVGTRFAYKRKAFGPISQNLDLVVTEMDADRRFAFRFSGSTQAKVSYTLQPAGAAATVLQVDGRFELPGPQFLVRLMKGSVDRQVTDAQRRIKQLVESST